MKRFTGSVRLIMTALLCLLAAASAAPAYAAGGGKVYTPYTDLSAPPGETINYSVDLINDSADILTAAVGFSAPSGWTYELTAGGNNIRQISVKPNDTQTMNLTLHVPLEVEKGDYSFQLSAGAFGTLPIKVNVSEKGSYKSELTVDQPNMQGHSDSTFTYSLSLNNRTASKQTYALTAEAPSGWDGKFTVDGNGVTSVDIDPGASKTVTLNLTPAENAKADTYKVAVHAASGSSTADAEVEAVITGTYAMTLSTSDERLSADVTAGHERKLELVVKNTGSADLTDINLTSTPPANWEISFEPKTINTLKAGESKPVTATIKASGKALAGDYVVGLTAQASEKSADAAIRMTVKSSVLWGWIGVLIILAVIAGVYGLFRKYGRR
ncbi:NEW3 domain-containing protein [Cohnella caldifontis]|uniref:COG1470 family protein n=1 Tax=Cohnella caldifontis TaxID=3027471 RepID=UPI0023EB5F24|nr:NEW3 domain-containing protein [Cohnella sp. YIM B05605]